jgi:hypothetical protein
MSLYRFLLLGKLHDARAARIASETIGSVQLIALAGIKA